MTQAVPTAFSSLGKVEVETLVGDLYAFPAMDREELRKVIPKGPPTVSSPTLAMINASFAVMSIPFRVIRTIKVDGDVWWTASSA